MSTHKYTQWPNRSYGKLFLVNDQRDAQILFYVLVSIYNFLYVSSPQCSSSGETNCFNTASGNSHSTLVAEMCAGWKKLHGQQTVKLWEIVSFFHYLFIYLFTYSRYSFRTDLPKSLPPLYPRSRMLCP